MRRKSILQFGGNEIEIEAIEKRVKAIWSQAGNLQKDITELRLYLKPEENRAYYVINENFSGDVSL